MLNFSDTLTPAFRSLLEILETMLELDVEADNEFTVEDNVELDKDVEDSIDDDKGLLETVDECTKMEVEDFNELEDDALDAILLEEVDEIALDVFLVDSFLLGVVV